MRHLLFLAAALSALLISHSVAAQDLVVDGTTMTLGGEHHYRSVRVINGGVIEVPPFDGTDRANTGNLLLIADSIAVDATSRITARGAGYQTARCANGAGPAVDPAAGGRGGCALKDSGGGGAHFGGGGRGTKDCFLCGSATSCEFPEEFESDCGNTLNAAGTACTSETDCRGASCAVWNGLPTTAGQSYWHSIYDVEFGASGGDKGCRDGDGFATQPAVGGAGGGRIVLVSLTAAMDGSVDIAGTVSSNGKRGCGTGNDSGGGGAGGTVFVVADNVTVEGGARVSAAGGRGGDTFAAATGSPDYQDCPPGAQTGGTCDDCGGGGGGGIISILSRSRTLSEAADFDVSGAPGGVCPICTGEAGGGAGELQLDGLYVGEVCDGYDDDFDGMIDEGFGSATCGLGTCAASIPECSGGVPASCTPTVTPGDASCTTGCGDTRPRVAVILDTSASMLEDLSGYPTFGDGSEDHPGLDTDGDGMPNDSRLFLAKQALGDVISAYPEIDFALARYHQDTQADISCQTATWLECAGIFASYDNPTDNTGPLSCNVKINATTSVPVHRDSHGDECINYAGNCGAPGAARTS